MWKHWFSFWEFLFSVQTVGMHLWTTTEPSRTLNRISQPTDTKHTTAALASVAVPSGCQGGVVPLTEEHVVLLGVVRPLWSPPDTQLSPVAPRSCLHATAATPRATASTGRQNLVRVADAFITIGDLGLLYLCMWRLDLADCAEETTRLVQRAGSRTQQSVVEREQGTVRHKDTAGHSLHLNLSPVVSIYLATGPSQKGTREWGWRAAQLSLTIIQLTRKSRHHRQPSDVIGHRRQRRTNNCRALRDWTLCPRLLQRYKMK